jgi:hypothetical protein
MRSVQSEIGILPPKPGERTRPGQRAAGRARLRDDSSSGRGSETSSQASKATQNLVIAGRAPLMTVGRSVGRRLSKRSTRLADALSFDP